MASQFTWAAAPAANVPAVVLGKDVALTAFPLNSLCSTLTATINDTTSVINSQDVLKEVLRLTDYADNRKQRTCPTYLDTYLEYRSGNGAINTPLGSYTSATTHDTAPNGAFYNIEFTDSTGNVLVGNGAYADPVNGLTINYVNGVPVGDGVRTAFSIYFRFRSTEAIVLSPFIFSDDDEGTGLFGINNIQIICNLQQPSRVLRNDPTAFGGPGFGLGAVTYNTLVPTGAFQNSIMNVQFLTPSLDVELPPKSVVPYMEFPRYISQPSQAIAAGATSQIQSQTITLPQIPDLILVFVKALKSGANPDPQAPQFADGYLAVASGLDAVRNPLSVNFDNFSGLLSSHTAEELYTMSVRNGLEMDWNQWSGRAQVAGANAGPAGALGGKVGLTGGMLALKPSVDITLQPGQAPSLVGNFTLQLNLTVRNNYSFEVIPQMYIITVNSGFVESIRGSSRIIKGVLSEQDIISAPMAGAGSRASLQRLVGAGFMSKLGNALSKAKEIYHATKPIGSAIRGALPEGKAKEALGMAGYGTGAGTGAGRGKKSLAMRLM